MSDHAGIKKTYYKIFFALIGLTFLTGLVAFINFGPLNLPIALGIAVLKATLVMLFFMHIRHANRLTQLVSVIAFFWLIILMFTTLSDYETRGWALMKEQPSWVVQEPSHFVRR